MKKTIYSNDSKNVVKVSADYTKYYSDLSKKYSDEAKAAAQSAEASDTNVQNCVNRLLTDEGFIDVCDNMDSIKSAADNATVAQNASEHVDEVLEEVLGIQSAVVQSKNQAASSADSAEDSLEQAQQLLLDIIDETDSALDKINEAYEARMSDYMMYTTGNVSEDVEGFKQLVQRAHSTFDISKFEVVGSPVITEDGKVSGINGNNQIKYGNFDFKNSCSVKFKFCITGIDSSNNAALLRLYDVSNNSEILIFITISGNLNIFYKVKGGRAIYSTFGVPALNKEYEMKLEVNNNNFKATLSQNNEIIESIEKDEALELTNFSLTSGSTILGSLIGYIDLKYFSVVVDGLPVFTGNVTGIDTIKPDDYQIVGSPVVSDIGLANGFISGSYIKIPGIDLEQKYTIKGRFATGDDITTVQIPMGVSANSELLMSLRINSVANRISLVVNNTDDDNAVLSTPLDMLKVNTVYDYSIEVDGADLTFTINDYTASVSNFNNLNIDSITLGCDRSYTFPFVSGYIDLCAFKIYSKDTLVYQPCLKIPYTLSKTGSKIVDALYRDRVSDVYEEYGQARYYTLDENNKNFTLPMGEIYGMLEQQTTNLPIGSIIPVITSSDYTPESCLLCDGSEYSEDLFPDFYNDYLAGNRLQTCTYNEFAEQIEEYGFCESFALDSENKKFKVPLTNKYRKLVKKVTNDADGYNLYSDGWCEQWGSVDLSEASQQAYLTVNLTLPYKSTNYIVSVSNWHTYDSSNSSTHGYVMARASVLDHRYKETDSFKFFNWGKSYFNNWHTSGYVEIPNSTINNIQEYVVISNQSISKSAMDWSQWASGLEGKANKDMSNVTMPYVKETYQNGDSWYRLWSDGRIEQGGLTTGSENSFTVTLLKPYTTETYTVLLTILNTVTNSENNAKVKTRTASDFTVYAEANERPMMWYCCGI